MKNMFGLNIFLVLIKLDNFGFIFYNFFCLVLIQIFLKISVLVSTVNLPPLSEDMYDTPSHMTTYMILVPMNFDFSFYFFLIQTFPKVLILLLIVSLLSLSDG